jgi:hypothetical protein
MFMAWLWKNENNAALGCPPFVSSPHAVRIVMRRDLRSYRAALQDVALRHADHDCMFLRSHLRQEEHAQSRKRHREYRTYERR